MYYSFLEEEIESILLFACAPVYILVLNLLQTRHLKLLEQIKKKNLSDEYKPKLKVKLRKLKLRSPLLLLLGTFVHSSMYLIFAGELFRIGYFISIAIVYFLFLLIAIVNFYLKGASVLKDIGKFGGLPGN